VATEPAGRSCPLHYRYRPEQLCQVPEAWAEDVLYVIGGLYGNPFALDAIEAMAAEERAAGRSVRLLFNGDFNWFNASAPWFADINRRVLRHDASLGNVEFELASPNRDAGCGCGYPDFVEDGVVERSNRIIRRLQQQARSHPEIQRQLKALPRWRCLIFGGLKILVLHGDPESLAGWGLSRESLAGQGSSQLRRWFRQTGADLILCSHTCLPLMWSTTVDGRPCGLINNGAAGLGCLAGDHRGLMVRLAASGPSMAPLAGLQAGALSAALVPVDFALGDWLSLFDELWPAGSAAAISYRGRVQSGTALAPADLFLSC